MASEITILVSDFENSKTPQKMVRRNLSYKNAEERLKRKLASSMASESNHDTNLLIHAATVFARKECSFLLNVAFVLKETLKTPEFPSESRMQIQCQKPTPLSPDEARTYLLENTRTKQQYISTRLLNKSHNSDIYPPYNERIEAKLQYNRNLKLKTLAH